MLIIRILSLLCVQTICILILFCFLLVMKLQLFGDLKNALSLIDRTIQIVSVVLFIVVLHELFVTTTHNVSHIYPACGVRFSETTKF